MKVKRYKGLPKRECSKVIRKEWPAEPDRSKCSRYTAFTINGKPYCKQHAGELALKEFL